MFYSKILIVILKSQISFCNIKTNYVNIHIYIYIIFYIVIFFYIISITCKISVN